MFSFKDLFSLMISWTTGKTKSFTFYYYSLPSPALPQDHSVTPRAQKELKETKNSTECPNKFFKFQSTESQSIFFILITSFGTEKSFEFQNFGFIRRTNSVKFIL